MKLILAFIAALVAFVFSPISFEVAFSALVALGFAAIVVADYFRPTRPLSIRSAALAHRPERLRLAA